MTSDILSALAADAELAEKAHKEVAALCSGKRQWTMRVPVDLEHDSDIIFSTAADRLELALSVLQQVAELHKPVKRYQSSPDDYWSYDTAEEAAKYNETPIEDVTYFEFCGQCDRVETLSNPYEYEWGNRESSWPCRTAKVLNRYTQDGE